jgi:hypothetical protein
MPEANPGVETRAALHCALRPHPHCRRLTSREVAEKEAAEGAVEALWHSCQNAQPARRW